MKRLVFKLPGKSAKKDFIFNMYGSVSVSFVSVILLIAVSRILGEESAGVFSLSYSTAQMLYTLAAFEVRNIQVTDTKGEFEFSECLAFRTVTVLAMLTFAICFVFIKGFDTEKTIAILLLCIYMAFMALGEVFQGNMHKNGYLHLSGFSLGTSVVFAAGVFIVSMLITGKLLISIIPMIMAMVLWVCLFDIPVASNFSAPRFKFTFEKIKKLFLYTFPLIISVFINQYSLNCPKYAIDKYLTAVDQSHYGYLVMPAFCINLLSMFVFRPQILTLSKKWGAKEYKGFNKIALLLFGWIIIATAVVILGGYLLGIPVLNLLYNTNLNDQKQWLMVLLIGGGFSAASSLCCMLVAVTRKQNCALIAYVTSTAVALVLPNVLVKNMGFAGAPISYLIQNAVLFLGLFTVLFITVFSKALKRGKQNEV
ncbi:MAG: lipopolysaccharide biosynthesis protein [Clostridia bacterium]|nr:lipopolysaccharide biosynthesis protein [Clostridia bacterium]